MQEHKTWYPKGKLFISTTEYEQAILDNIDEVLNGFEEIDLNGRNISFLEKIQPQTYRIKSAPSFELLSSLPYYKNCNSEVGIICLNHQWLIILGVEGEHKITFPEELQTISHSGVFQFHMHSHPANQEDDDLGQPSVEDFESCYSTIDGCQYIASEKGITEICRCKASGIDLLGKTPSLWRNWVLNDLKLTEQQYYKIGEWKLIKMFCETFLEERIIPWSNKESILTLILEKEKLKSVASDKKI